MASACLGEVSYEPRRPVRERDLVNRETFVEASADVVNGLRAVQTGPTPDFAFGYARASASRALQETSLSTEVSHKEIQNLSGNDKIRNAAVCIPYR